MRGRGVCTNAVSGASDLKAVAVDGSKRSHAPDACHAAARAGGKGQGLAGGKEQGVARGKGQGVAGGKGQGLEHDGAACLRCMAGLVVGGWWLVVGGCLIELVGG